MTCIVAVRTQDSVVMGADSCGFNAYLAHPRSDPKVFFNGDFLFGCTSSYRMAQVLMFDEVLADMRCDDVVPMRFMVTTFVPRCREAFAAGGYLHKKEEREAGGTFLCAFGRHLFCVDSDFQVAEPRFDYDAVGSGAAVALGALYAQSDEIAPRDRIRTALRASETYVQTVGGPFVILATTDRK